jgi:hypothetical protein
VGAFFCHFSVLPFVFRSLPIAREQKIYRNLYYTPIARILQGIFAIPIVFLQNFCFSRLDLRRKGHIGAQIVNRIEICHAVAGGSEKFTAVPEKHRDCGSPQHLSAQEIVLLGAVENLSLRRKHGCGKKAEIGMDRAQHIDCEASDGHGCGVGRKRTAEEVGFDAAFDRAPPSRCCS